MNKLMVNVLRQKSKMKNFTRDSVLIFNAHIL